MIKINTKEDPRIAEDFPNDPYSNLTIVTQTQKLYLQLAFLTMDSAYFARIDPDTREIDLRDLKEDPLIKVLHSLYGQQLVANSIGELAQLYPIIAFLEIDDYKKAVEEEVASSKDILESVEFIQLSHRYEICWEKVIETHIENKLRILEDSKNYLQLSKIEDQTFNLLLLSFLQRHGDSYSKTLNNVMENYFNRKAIKPIAYLKEPALAPLQAIWFKYHHILPSELTPKSSPTIQAANSFESSAPSMTASNIPSKMSTTNASVEEKRKRVLEMEQQIASKDSVIEELSKRIEQLKKQLGFNREMSKPVTARSLLIEGEGEQTRGRRQSKRLEDLLGQGHSDNQSIPEQRRGRNNQMRQCKPMHRLGSKNLKKL